MPGGVVAAGHTGLRPVQLAGDVRPSAGRAGAIRRSSATLGVFVSSIPAYGLTLTATVLDQRSIGSWLRGQPSKVAPRTAAWMVNLWAGSVGSYPVSFFTRSSR